MDLEMLDHSAVNLKKTVNTGKDHLDHRAVNLQGVKPEAKAVKVKVNANLKTEVMGKATDNNTANPVVARSRAVTARLGVAARLVTTENPATKGSRGVMARLEVKANLGKENQLPGKTANLKGPNGATATRNPNKTRIAKKPPSNANAENNPTHGVR